MSLESATAQIEAQLPQLSSLGYKVKFAIPDEGVILVDASATPATLTNEDGEADCTIRLSEDRLSQLIEELTSGGLLDAKAIGGTEVTPDDLGHRDVELAPVIAEHR